MITIWPLLLPVAAFSGWYFARKPNAKELKSELGLSQRYVRGVNYILNEQPDKAIDIFIKMLEVDEDTVETHLSLGGLFRRRGEVDRAIRIHQNLIARPQLSHGQRVDALMALGQDYLCAGVYDRAERVFNEGADLGGRAKKESLKNLYSIYLQQKSWAKSLEVLKALQAISAKPLAMEMAHSYCELTEDAIKSQQFGQANQLLKKALLADKNLVRVSMLQGKLEFLQQNYRQAIKAYKKVVVQDSAYLSEIIQPLASCYQNLGAEAQFQKYLTALLDVAPRTTTIFYLAQYLKQDTRYGDAVISQLALVVPVDY